MYNERSSHASGGDGGSGGGGGGNSGGCGQQGGAAAAGGAIPSVRNAGPARLGDNQIKKLLHADGRTVTFRLAS